MPFEIRSQAVKAAGAALLFLAHLPAISDTFSGRVVGVADGDTVTVLDASMVQHKVRLSGIDAPEKSQPFGQRSKESLSDLVFDRWVTVESDKRDRYGREVGKVLKDGQDANLEQIVRGFAWHYKDYAREQSVQDREVYANAEDASRRKRTGLWSDAHSIPPWEFRRKKREKRKTQQVEMEGR